MKICVLNGSPKGKYSVTLQTVLYLEKLFHEHEFNIINVGQRIKAFERSMKEALTQLEEADLIVFAYPVYTFLAPAQLHRFIELLKESEADLSGKFATQITTSKHFYDVTAHRYIEDNCHDMGLKVIHGLSADMDDLRTKQGQLQAENFMRYVSFCCEKDIYEKKPESREYTAGEYLPRKSDDKKDDRFDTVIVTDLSYDDTRLKAMIDDFKAVYRYRTRVVNIGEYPFKGGCLGCFNCAGDGKCVYNDGFDSFLREKIQSADAVVYAFTVRDHSMGAKFKTYDDRQFCNGHRTVTEGMPFGYIVNGDYENEQNLRTLIEARCDVGHNFLSGVGVDGDTVKAMAERLEYALEHRYVQPRSFYGVGGMKIFRDLIWLMRGIMKADHEFYKQHGIYDFPQKKRLSMMGMCILGAMVRNPKIKAKMGNKMAEGMVAPYKKVIDSLDETK